MIVHLGYFFVVSVPDENDFAVFTHVKGKVYTDFNEIRQEIEAETDRLGGKKVSIDGPSSRAAHVWI